LGVHLFLPKILRSVTKKIAEKRRFLSTDCAVFMLMTVEAAVPAALLKLQATRPPLQKALRFASTDRIRAI
jgi:hypothetical protein